MQPTAHVKAYNTAGRLATSLSLIELELENRGSGTVLEPAVDATKYVVDHAVVATTRSAESSTSAYHEELGGVDQFMVANPSSLIHLVTPLTCIIRKTLGSAVITNGPSQANVLVSSTLNTRAHLIFVSIVRSISLRVTS